MPDREKLIKALTLCANGEPCITCPYSPIGKPEYYDCGSAMTADILALLREQKPVEPKNGKCPECGYTVHRINYDGPYNGIRHEWFRFCPSCGRAVKWD